MDRIDRRILLMFSAVLMALSIFCLSLYFEIEAPYAGWISLFYICIFVSAFSLGFGPVPWIIIGEIFSTEVCFSIVYCHIIMIKLNFFLRKYPFNLLSNFRSFYNKMIQFYTKSIDIFSVQTIRHKYSNCYQLDYAVRYSILLFN